MADTPPDHGCSETESPFYVNVRARPVGIRFNGVEQKTVVEYCVSEGWIECHKRDWKGRAVRDGELWKRGPRLTGKVEAYYITPRDWSAEI